MAVVISLAITAIVLNGTSGSSDQPAIVSLRHGRSHLRILLVGDSMAGTLGIGLAKAAPASGITLINAALVGCGVSIAWDGGWASSILTPGPPAFPCQSADELTRYWSSFLKRYRPAVVVYVDRMDTISQEVTPGSSQRMTSVLDGSFRTYLTSALTQAVSVLSSYGAKVILATSVPTKIGLIGNANDNPQRWIAYDKILGSVAAKSDGKASVYGLGEFFGGTNLTFSLKTRSGVQWRCADGIHIAPAGGILAAASLFRFARNVVAGADPPHAVARAVPASIANQPWPPFAAQQHAMGCPA
jgi:hypothetical protein